MTIVSLTGNIAGASLVIEETPMISLALAFPIDIALPDELVASTVTSAGDVITGLVVSLIVTV